MKREFKWTWVYVIIAVFIMVMFTENCTAQVKIDSVYIFHPDGRYLMKNYQDSVSPKLDSLNRIYKTDQFILYFFFNDGQILVNEVSKRKAVLDIPKKEII